MQLSDATNLQGIFEDIDFFAQTTLVTYPATHKVRNINNRFRNDILLWIWECYDGWQFNDSNQTDDVLYADQTLTTGVSVYAIPASAILITGVEILLPGTTVYQRLLPYTQELASSKPSISQFLKTSSVPITYQLVGDSLKILPPPNWTAATSLRVWFWKDVVSFAVTDTTPAPGIPSMFHRALSIGAALDWAMANKKELIPVLMKEYNDPRNPDSQKAKVQNFFKKRFQEFASPPVLRVADAVSEFQ